MNGGDEVATGFDIIAVGDLRNLMSAVGADDGGDDDAKQQIEIKCQSYYIFVLFNVCWALQIGKNLGRKLLEFKRIYSHSLTKELQKKYLETFSTWNFTLLLFYTIIYKKNTL